MLGVIPMDGVIDYNGGGDWSLEAIRFRYAMRCAELGVVERELVPDEVLEGSTRWIFPVMWEVIARMELGDRACIAIGIDYLEGAGQRPFGRLIRTNVARALRRSELDEAQKDRLRRHVVGVLVSGRLQREMKELAKMLRVIGVGPYWDELEAGIDPENRFAVRYYRYLAAAGGVGPKYASR